MWVSRDEDGVLIAWEELPHRSIYDYWSTYGTNNHIILDSNLFPNLTWNDEPIEVDIVPRKKMDKKTALITMANHAEEPNSIEYKRAKQDWLDAQ